MSDIQRLPALIKTDPELSKKHTQIIINEKISQIKGLEIRLEDLKNIDQKRIELQIETLKKEVNNLIKYKEQIIDVQIHESEKKEEEVD